MPQTVLEIPLMALAAKEELRRKFGNRSLKWGCLIMELGWLDIDKQERQPQVYTLEENIEVKCAYVTAYKA